MKHRLVPAIDSPCPKDWHQMQGDDKRRYCEHCQLHVHNLSAMTTPEQHKLLTRSTQRLCVAYSTATSIPVRPSAWLWWQRLTMPLRTGLALLMSFIPFLSSCGTTETTSVSNPIVRDLQRSTDGSLTLGKVRVEPDDASSPLNDWEKLRGSGKMIAGGIMPPPRPWWKRLLHID